ncbi:MAG: DUF1579 family protein [Planctomycetes bacterium]|nr:DUF1579 family protein [Planctomycetota bacterium]
MECPQPNAEHRKLERLAGTWRGKETMHPSEWNPDGCIADGVTTSRMAIGGFGVVTDYEQSIGGNTTFSGHGVYTVDQSNNDVVLYWFDSMGTGCEEFRGGWDGDKLVLRSKSPMMGHMRMTYDFGTDGKLRSSMECSQDGAQWRGMFDGDYDRG